jgi:hypothetical protein
MTESERGMAPLQVKWCGVAPMALTGRHGNGTMLHSYRTYLAARS